ncbi:hypothetical protein EVA_14782 [gut metagenome]|uniref:Uncharacterized protein n=1 Tax=gut metagenome TaxID=749906 RepID=J9CB45_9ZZZZ
MPPYVRKGCFPPYVLSVVSKKGGLKMCPLSGGVNKVALGLVSEGETIRWSSNPHSPLNL